MDKDQRIRDPVHNLIKFSKYNGYDSLYWSLIQQPAFQRLRRIRQLGFSEFVYPGASHTRFSHSIGAFQMARRMFEAFEKNEIFRVEGEHEKMRAATLAAVLLHDIGHGPFSHVFEEISEELEIDVSHEQYTRRIISETEIAKLLDEFGLRDLVLTFFDEKVASSSYSAIVSSQLDADRLDFLTRDRYFTGIRIGQIDHEWLFDSLRIEDVPYGVEEGESEFTFVVLQKGLGALEDYISSYLKLYESVYLHKTTRGVQFLVEHALSDALRDRPALKRAGIVNPLLDYFELAPDKRLQHYLTMDDGDVLDLLKQLARAEFGFSTEMARRFITRQPLRCFEPNDPNREFDLVRTKKFRERLNGGKIWYHLDISKAKGFKQYEVLEENFLKNIMVKVSDTQTRPIGEVDSSLVTKTRQRCRFYFLTEKDKETAEKLWRD
jgi:uncharacterized protein